MTPPMSVDLFPAQLNPVTRTVRGRRVVLDTDLARLYRVQTQHVIARVAHNRERFPTGFAFQLTRQEAAVVAGRAPRRKSRPWAFTLEGAAMLSSVLNSATAAQFHVEVIRSTPLGGFVRA